MKIIEGQYAAVIGLDIRINFLASHRLIPNDSSMNYGQPSYTSRRGFLNGIVGTTAVTALLGRSFAVANTDLPAPPVSGLIDFGGFKAIDAIDGDTLAFDDGSRLRLCGIEAPKDGMPGTDAVVAALAKQARMALAKLAVGRPLRLYGDASPTDRHGRRVAQAVGNDGLWLQAEMLKLGLARVHGQVDHRLGLRELLAFEVAARQAGTGLWSATPFALRRADDPGLTRLAASFQIVGGKVTAAERRRDLGFINFGADPKTDLTLVLKKDALKLCDASNIAIEGLRDREIRCRGWLAAYNGPNIEITHPEQIELPESQA
jgi:endonuclease YncB( thermonuclease family)